MTILSVDGRQIGAAAGMTGEELRAELEKLGVWTAINLDGGGSTTLVVRDRKEGDWDVLNRPSDGKERPVATVVGVMVKE
jgi:exopolysaccharide biosynthesis protein